MTEDCLSNFRWCIENDFQVYVKPINYSGNFKVAIRNVCNILIKTHNFLYWFIKITS